MMFVWMAGNFEFHRVHHKQACHPPLLAAILFDQEKTVWLHLHQLQTIRGMTDALQDYLPENVKEKAADTTQTST